MMMSVRAILLLSLSAVMSEALGSMRKVSPELKPSSDKKFRKEDYPHDQAPKADTLHFKHPYPVVQDSGDFDRDFVKDENSDDGHWKAQETYDRLRIKLSKEQRDLAKTLATQQKSEKELQDAIAKHDQAAKDRLAAEAAKKEVEKQHALRKTAAEEEKVKTPPSTKQFKGKPLIKGPDQNDIDAETQKVKNAEESLKECESQLEEAKKKLKDLQEQLDAAKKDQSEANAIVEESDAKVLDAKKTKDGIEEEVSIEHADYIVAKKAYEEQLDLVQKLDAKIKVAAAKVKAMRDAEDGGGGVYNTPEKSGMIASAAPRLLALAVMVALAS